MSELFAQGRLGEDNELVQTLNPADMQRSLITMLGQARDIVRISSPLLNPAVFNHEDVRSAVSAFARSSRNAQVRILVGNTHVLAERGHRLLKLGRRLSTSVVLRKPEMHEHEVQPEYVLVDDSGTIEIAAAEQDPASVYFCNRVRNKTLAEQFDLLWHKSHTPVELRSIVL
jgi:hypothetical protein